MLTFYDQMMHDIYYSVQNVDYLDENIHQHQSMY
jgi:hypothetical protein